MSGTWAPAPGGGKTPAKSKAARRAAASSRANAAGFANCGVIYAVFRFAFARSRIRASFSYIQDDMTAERRRERNRTTEIWRFTRAQVAASVRLSTPGMSYPQLTGWLSTKPRLPSLPAHRTLGRIAHPGRAWFTGLINIAALWGRRAGGCRELDRENRRVRYDYRAGGLPARRHRRGQGRHHRLLGLRPRWLPRAAGRRAVQLRHRPGRDARGNRHRAGLQDDDAGGGASQRRHVPCP